MKAAATDTPSNASLIFPLNCVLLPESKELCEADRSIRAHMRPSPGFLLKNRFRQYYIMIRQGTGEMCTAHPAIVNRFVNCHRFVPPFRCPGTHRSRREQKGEFYFLRLL